MDKTGTITAKQIQFAHTLIEQISQRCAYNLDIKSKMDLRTLEALINRMEATLDAADWEFRVAKARKENAG